MHRCAESPAAEIPFSEPLLSDTPFSSAFLMAERRHASHFTPPAAMPRHSMLAPAFSVLQPAAASSRHLAISSSCMRRRRQILIFFAISPAAMLMSCRHRVRGLMLR